MAKIILGLADAAEQEAAAAALRLARHNVTALDAPADGAAGNPGDAARRLLAPAADVAILDYILDDAFSVKVLQAATDAGGTLRFIFVLPDGVPVSHILMAVNEGASALLPRPLEMEALKNYVERAMSGPARFRHDLAREADMAESYADIEQSAKAMKMRLASNRKLISYLLGVPVSAQHRSALLVSDSAYQREQLKKLLEDHGFQVSMAATPAEGLKTALDERPRIVISDLEMEGQNGIEFCHELKIVNKFVPCFFVICTANSEKISSVMAPGNGVDACVMKPADESANQELVATAAMGLLL